jgi:two-component system LytT family sensor kinase
VTIAFVVIATFGAQSLAFDQFLRVDPRQVGALVTMWVATTLAYPAQRHAISWFVDSVILRRPDYRSLRATLARRMQAHDDVPALLTELCVLLTPAMSAQAVTWHEWAAPLGEDVGSSVVAVGDAALRVVNALAPAADGDGGEARRPAAAVLIPVAEAPRYALVVAGLTGGRRLLSDDLLALESIAIVIARRIDAIRITRERYHRELREQEIAKLVTEAELRALRAQVNPHFLFNALTTLGYLIQTAPDRALETLLRLTSLLRGVLRSEGEFATLGRELDIVEAYLEIEQARFEERLRIRIDVPPALRTIRVPALLLQPIVENAVKHGVAPLAEGGDVTIRGTLERAADGSLELSLTVTDTGAGVTAADLRRGRALGVGLSNVERRLQGQYGRDASLSIQSVPGAGTTVTIRLPAESSRTADQPVRSAR